MSDVNILGDFIKHLKGKDTKIAKRILWKWLNYDPIYGIYHNGAGCFWIELIGTTYGGAYMPDYAFKYIKSWCKRQGLEYIYDKTWRPLSEFKN